MEKTILIIDDDSRNILAMSAVLKSRGFLTDVASEMEDALERIRKEPPDLVLLDMMMPGMDGYEALSVIRSDELLRSIPVISVTAQAMPGDREKCLDAGASDYISKPVDVDRLMTLLRKYLK